MHGKRSFSSSIPRNAADGAGKRTSTYRAARRRPRISPAARAAVAAHFEMRRRLAESERALAAADVELERRERVIQRVASKLAGGVA